jgi:hypothetical protein
VAVVRRSCRKRRSVVESVWRKMFGLLKLHLESVNTFPVFQGLLLLLSEICAFGDYIDLRFTWFELSLAKHRL